MLKIAKTGWQTEVRHHVPRGAVEKWTQKEANLYVDFPFAEDLFADDAAL